MSYPLPTNPSGSIFPFSIKPGEQVFIDPAGWFFVILPAGWKDYNRPGSFYGDYGFFETEYLTQMMFRQDPVDICQWLANISTKDIFYIRAPTYLSPKANNCILAPLSDNQKPFVQTIIQNPKANYEQRYFSIKTDAKHFDQIMNTFTWLRPVDPYETPRFRPAPLSSTEEQFWGNPDPLPAGLVMTEYLLSPEANQERPSEKEFLKFIPAEARRARSAMIQQGRVEVEKPDINEQLRPFGYELRSSPSGETYLKYLFKDEELLFKDVLKISSVYTFTTETGLIWALVVDTLENTHPDFKRFVIENGSIYEWEYHPFDFQYPPIINKGRLLWVHSTDKAVVRVQTSNQEIVYSFATFFGAKIPFHQFTSWDNDWILEIGNFIIQDGEILNEKLGFEETFSWQLIQDKPFFFFRKGQRVGISYDGKVLPVYYHDVSNHLCCGLSGNNPIRIGNSVHFLGQRNYQWYYVILEFQ